MTASKRLAKIEDASCLAFSGDGSSLAVGAGKNVTVLDVATGETKFVFDGHEGTVSSINSSRDGTMFLSGDGPHASTRDRPWLAICLWDAGSGEVVSRIENREGTALGLDLDKSNARVAATFDSQCLCAWYQGEVAERIGMFMVNGDPKGIAYLANGAKIAYAHSYFDGLTDNYFIKVINPLDGGEELQIRSESTLSAFAVSPNEKFFSAGRSDGSIEIWNAGTGELLSTLEGPEYPVDAVSWNESGTELVATHRELGERTSYFSIGIWSPQDPVALRSKKTSVDHLVCGAISRDAKKLATISGFPVSIDVFDLEKLL